MRKIPKVDRWTLVEIAGAALMGAGVWVEWGPQWACMLWGGLLLALATLRAVMALYLTNRREQ